MQKLTYFKLASCPYCRECDRFLEALKAEHPAYKDIEIEVIDEGKHPDIAEKYDYYYVPTFFMGDKKLHEGASTMAKIKAVLDAALL